AMIKLAGGENAVSGFEDFKPLTPEALLNANPDVILMFTSGLESLGGMDGLLKVPGIAMTNAGKKKQVIEMDGQYLTGFGPRLGKAIAELSKKLDAVNKN
ncbi:MAG TPA: ABC transporter substrate-binding protein, partial [Chitinophagaceae bacterium]|nr:ABC transporter substrate-binding protein [Chitinophagaceae bacterium]